MSEQQTLETTGLTAQQVREYLLQSPDFYNQYPELLDDIPVTEKHGGVVSLTMRHLAVLREKNAKLQQQLDGLLAIARENDALFGRMQQLTTALLDARCVEDVFATLDDTLKECFSADFFSIRLIQGETESNFPISNVVWQQGDAQLEHFKRLLDSQKIKCGLPTHAQAEALFAEQAEAVKSAALIPLKIDQQDGVLAIGSKDTDRFRPTMGTLFLTHLGELVAKRLYSLKPVKQ